MLFFSQLNTPESLFTTRPGWSIIPICLPSLRGTSLVSTLVPIHVPDQKESISNTTSSTTLSEIILLRQAARYDRAMEKILSRTLPIDLTSLQSEV